MAATQTRVRGTGGEALASGPATLSSSGTPYTTKSCPVDLRGQSGLRSYPSGVVPEPPGGRSGSHPGSARRTIRHFAEQRPTLPEEARSGCRRVPFPKARDHYMTVDSGGATCSPTQVRQAA
jgi:hypothetical protein